MQLKYYIPFRAQAGDLNLALKERLLNIEGEAIDTSVNANKWQIPEEDLDFFVSSLHGSQLRIDHAESAMAVIGKVPEAKRQGQTVWFRAEIGELPIIEKVCRGYLSHVSVQVDSEDVECSSCHKPSRDKGLLIHLCPGAWEIVHKPRVRELSIVASPAYKNTEFKPVGFAAAMNESQGMLARGAANSYDDVQQRIQTLLKKIDDLRSEEQDDSMRQLLNLGEKLSSLEKQLGEITAWEAEQKPEVLVASTFLDDLLRGTCGEPSHLGKQMDKMFEAQGMFEGYFGDLKAMQALRRLNGLPEA